ncbi:zinc-regulated protein 8-like [Diaphorina citri]|uniref:Zinc-regulated protein 8-like n=1 Tax=Diaphorina citri TaxID=121845 RepID=A0A3Q0JJX4_DIACI|nr:zinc-regulated protein 8-like [Diaphorina citri]
MATLTGGCWKIICIRIIVNILVVFLLGISAYTIIEVVSRSQDPNRPQTVWHKNEAVVVIWIIGVTFPRLLEKLGNLEQLHPRKHLRMLLARIMVLQVVNLYTFFLEHLSETGDTIAELQRLKPKGNGSSSTTSSPSYTPMPNVRDCLRKLVRCSLVTHLLTNNFSNVTYLPSSTASTILPGTLPGKFNVTNTSHHLFVNTSSGDLSGLNGTFSTAILNSTLSSVPYNSTVISLTINSTYNSVFVNSTLTSVTLNGTLNYTLNSATTYPNITSANINVNQSQSKGIQTTYFGLNNTEFNGTIEDDVTTTGFSTVFSTNPTTFDNGNTTENSTRNVSSTQALPDTESHIPIDPGTTSSFDQSNTLSNGTRNNDTVVTGITEDPIESTTLDNVETPTPNEKSADGGHNTLRYDNTTLRAQTNDTDNESYEEYDDDLDKDEEDVTTTGFSTVFSTNPTTFDNGNTTENSTRNVSSTQALPDTESHIPIDPGTIPSFDQSNTLSNGTRDNDTVVTGITEDPIESTTLYNVENPNEKSADGGNNTLRYDNTTLRAQTNETDNESYEEYDDDLDKDEEDSDEGEEDEETLENGVNPNFPTPEYGERDELEERLKNYDYRDELEERLKNYDYALEWSHENQSESNNRTRQSNEEAVKIPIRSKRNSRSPVSLVNEIKQPQDDLDLFEEFEINENNLTEHGEASTKRISTANTEEVNNGEHLLNDLPIQTDSLKIIPTADETLIENDFPNLDSDLSMEHSATTFSDYFLENFTDNSNDVIEGVNPSESITPPVLLDAETTEEVDVVDTTPLSHVYYRSSNHLVLEDPTATGTY